jgi:glycosyltransferase involved in cell wall biosynthesis
MSALPSSAAAQPSQSGGYRQAFPGRRQRPPVTVITTVYNGAPQLERTIASVLAVDTPLEYIVIDGGSRDGTVELLRRYDSRIAYWVSEPDQGIYDAMNKGWALADPGSCVLYLGAGDELLSLPRQLGAYGLGEIVYGRVAIGERPYISTADVRLRLYNTMHHQALLVPKALHPAPPFDPAYRVYGDFDFNQRLLKAGARFIYDGSFAARALPGGLSSIFYVRESLRIVHKNFGAGWAALAVLAYLWLGLRKGFGRLSFKEP